jgi:hypothetical protein
MQHNETIRNIFFKMHTEIHVVAAIRLQTFVDVLGTAA